MQYERLGRTNLQVSVAGLGCGGHSRLGQAYGNTEQQSREVVAAALDAGVTFIDTAAAYRTESIVGEALVGKRHGVVISTKTAVRTRDADSAEARFLTGSEITARLEDSLRRLQTEYVDVYNMHGILLDELDYVHDALLPTLLELKRQGKIRHLGITERFVSDTAHHMLPRALAADAWDVIMVGFNLLNPSARERVLKPAIAADIGVQIMFAVRRALSNPEALRETLAEAVAQGQLPTDQSDALAKVLQASGAASLTELAYRFCRHEPGAHVILTGTGKVEHLLANLEAICGPPLPSATRDALASLFGTVDCISGN